ncbi:MAG TPA: glycosyl hydrolase [Abditibacteriaceae bacterium]|nr:glycosyl hydrolase [Abditibacteriaceae bacterium]
MINLRLPRSTFPCVLLPLLALTVAGLPSSSLAASRTHKSSRVLHSSVLRNGVSRNVVRRSSVRKKARFRAPRFAFVPKTGGFLPPARIAAASLPPARIPAASSAPMGASSSSVVTQLAKFEPARGCYIGAFIEKDFTFQYKNSREKIAEFEVLTRKKHASYFTYVGYGTPFPSEWVASVKREGGAPQIAFEPNHGLEEVADSEYLRNWARDAARSGVPIFLRWASEMNGNWMKYSSLAKPVDRFEQYKSKFRLVAKIMHEEAPNVAMVWTPFAEPQRDILKYYPGDEWVDWVGLNIYSVYVNDGDPKRPAYDKDPLQQLQFIYVNFADRKPIHISEFAATVQCKGTGLDTVDFAINKMTRFYSGLKAQYPRVKSVNWFSLDTIRAGLANNNYSFLQNGRVLNAYTNQVSDPYFLSKVVSAPGDFSKTVKVGSTIGARGVRLREGTPSDLDLIANQSIVAATITEPRLRGVQNGEIVSGDLVLTAQIPQSLKPMGIIWKIDGRTVAMTNTAPFRAAIARKRFAPGLHSAQVQVMDQRIGQIYSSPPVEFQWN